VQALKGEDLTIYGDGNQTRSFCYVDDLIRGIVLVMNAENIGPGPFNLGNPVDYKMLDLANKILVLTKSSSKISYFPLPQDDPKKRKPDISKVKEKIDWTPKTNLEDGLAKTISFFKSTIEIDLNISQT
jgi:UDP-glucuronate decarboxylase